MTLKRTEKEENNIGLANSYFCHCLSFFHSRNLFSYGYKESSSVVARNVQSRQQNNLNSEYRSHKNKNQ